MSAGCASSRRASSRASASPSRRVLIASSTRSVSFTSGASPCIVRDARRISVAHRVARGVVGEDRDVGGGGEGVVGGDGGGGAGVEGGAEGGAALDGGDGVAGVERERHVVDAPGGDDARAGGALGDGRVEARVVVGAIVT